MLLLLRCIEPNGELSDTHSEITHINEKHSIFVVAVSLFNNKKIKKKK